VERDCWERDWESTGEEDTSFDGFDELRHVGVTGVVTALTKPVMSVRLGILTGTGVRVLRLYR